MPSITASAGIGGGEVTSLTTSSVTPSGSNRYAFYATTSTGNITSSTRYGGSGGTLLAKLGSDTSFLFGIGNLNAWGVENSPAASTTGYAAFPAETPTTALSSVFLDDVDQDTPLGTLVQAADTSGENDVVVSVTVTGLSAGQRVVAALGISSLSDGVVGTITGGTDTTVYGAASSDRDAAAGVSSGSAVLSGVASGSSLTLTATVNMPDGGFTGWAIEAYPVNGAGASGVSGTGANTTAAFTSAGVGDVDVAGAGANTLAGLVSAAVGAVLVAGASAFSLGDFTQSSAGGVLVTGTGANTVTHSSSGAGSVLVSGAGANNVADTTNAGAGTVADNNGTGANTVADTGNSGAGQVVAAGTGANTTETTGAGQGAVPVAGTSANTVDGFTQDASGIVGYPVIQGAGTATLDDASSAGVGTVGVAGQGAAGPSTTGAGAGTVAVTGAGANTLEGFTSFGSDDVFHVSPAPHIYVFTRRGETAVLRPLTPHTFLRLQREEIVLQTLRRDTYVTKTPVED